MTTPNWQTDRIETDGIHMNVYRTSQQDPRVILLHGLTDNGLCWLRTMNALCDDYPLLMPDARGHGLSDKPDSDYGALAHADDIGGLIDALKLNVPVLVGHSMGAETAAHVAYKYPDLVSGIILEDPPWRDDVTTEQIYVGMQDWREGLRQEQATLTQADLIKMGKETLSKWDDIEFEHWADATLQMSLNALDYMVDERVAWRELCQNIDCPTLLITADPELGAIVTPDIASEAMSLLPNAKHIHIPDAGHNIRREQFEPYMDTVRDFLGEFVK